MRIRTTCMKLNCTGGPSCPMYGCTHHEVQIKEDKSTRAPYSLSLYCRGCSAHIRIVIPSHIPESQSYIYLEEIADKINSGEIKLPNKKY